MSNRTVIRTVITPRAITRRVGPAGAGGGATTFAALTDKTTADLLVNTPLSTALSGKLSITGTAADVNPAGTSIASALSGKQPLDADLTSWAGVTRAAGFDTFTATPSSANLRSLVTDETGSGSLVFGTLPTLAGFSATGAVTFSTGTTFTYGAGIAAAHRTALGLGSLATQSGTFSGTHSGTHSGDSSGTNTGDQDLSNFLSRRTILEVNGTDAPISQSLVEQGYLSNGRRVWANGDGGTLLYDGASWFLTQLDPDSLVVYDAFKTSGSYEPWLLTGWTVTNGSGEPTFVLDPAEPLGNGVIIALDLPADTNGGFLTAGTGGTLPITRGGTGATTAGLARIALNGGAATGDALFTAPSPAEANATLGRLTVRKTADEILTNALLGSRTVSTDFAADSQLVIPLEANTLYRVEWGLLATSPNVELMKVRLTYPTRDVTDAAGSAISSGAWGNASPTNHSGTATALALSNHVGANQVRGNVGMMSLNIGATPGNLRVEWGKVAPGTGNTTMLKNSYLIATKIE